MNPYYLHKGVLKYQLYDEGVLKARDHFYLRDLKKFDYWIAQVYNIFYKKGEALHDNERSDTGRR